MGIAKKKKGGELINMRILLVFTFCTYLFSVLLFFKMGIMILTYFKRLMKIANYYW